MRCPKCGYISFDHLDFCTQCNKEIGLLTSEINGTIYKAVAPSFLKFHTAAPPRPTAAPIKAVNPPPPISLREGIDTEFFLEEEQEVALAPAESAFGDSEPLMDLDDFQEVSPRAEFTLDLDAEFDSGAAPLPPMDFSDLDISDLAPPDSGAVEEEEPAETIAEDASPLAIEPSSPPATPSRPAGGLEDLQVQDLELDAPSRLVSGSAAGKRYLPSVKTGTALDKFDIDLGDLFKEAKQQKSIDSNPIL